MWPNSSPFWVAKSRIVILVIWKRKRQACIERHKRLHGTGAYLYIFFQIYIGSMQVHALEIFQVLNIFQTKYYPQFGEMYLKQFTNIPKAVRTTEVIREEFRQFQEGTKELLRRFLEFFLSYGLELGRQTGDDEFQELSEKLRALGSSVKGKNS